jgi:hypothetical protein
VCSIPQGKKTTKDGNITQSSNISISSNQPADPHKATAADRLYKSAQVLKARHDYRKRVAEEAEAKEHKEKQFKLNSVSRQVLPTSRRSIDLDIGQRLYDDARSEKQRKDKELTKFSELPKPEDWSCAKCGSFQKAAPLDLKTVISQQQQQQQSLASTQSSSSSSADSNENDNDNNDGT